MLFRPLLVCSAVGLLATGAANAQDYYSENAVYGAPFDFEGLYLGASAGGYFGEDGAPLAGVVAGVNFSVDGFIYAGLEFQGGAVFADDWTYDVFALLHAGALVTDQILAYGVVGVGSVDKEGSYAIGAGAEYGAFAPFGLRGELLGVGEFGGGLDSGRATGTVVWHFN